MKATIVTVPCFSGAPWDLATLHGLADYPLCTMRLPEGKTSIEDYADFVLDQTKDLESYVLVGDSFGAIISLAVAVRQPPGLRALVMSGGFAADPVTSPLIQFKLWLGRIMPEGLYKAVTLRFHAASLASIYDKEGDNPWTITDSRQLFLQNTSHKSYIARSIAAFSADYRSRLSAVQVPTLLITPSEDHLIGPKAAEIMRSGIPNATEVVLDRTGHMFRFSHPKLYSKTIANFLESITISS